MLLQCSSEAERCNMMKTAIDMGNWWLAASSSQCTHSCITSCRVFLGNIKSPWWLRPLPPRFGILQLLAFPKPKITFEREDISDCQIDSGIYDGAESPEWFDVSQKNCTRCDAWAGVLSWWSCQSPVVHSYSLLNHLNSFQGGMLKLHTKSDADSLLCSLSHLECGGHTVHMVTQQHLLPSLSSTVKSSLFTCAFQSTLLGCQVTLMSRKPFLHLLQLAFFWRDLIHNFYHAKKNIVNCEVSKSFCFLI